MPAGGNARKNWRFLVVFQGSFLQYTGTILHSQCTSNELIEVWNERAHEHQLPCRVDGIVPLRVENIVAVLREPGKCEALEPGNIELARQTSEQLELVEERGEPGS